MRDFRYYKECFSNLHTAHSNKLPAPHKPLLLLSIIDLIERRLITSNRIELTDELVRAFKSNATRFIGHSVIFSPNIGQPFYHLQYEPFWRLIPSRLENDLSMAAEGTENYGKKRAVYSLKGLRECYKYALIDGELFELLQNADVRANLRTTLISKYLSEQPNTVSLLPLLPLIISMALIA